MSVVVDVNEYLTPVEAASYHNVSLKTVYKAMEDRRLTALEQDGRMVLSREQVKLWRPRKFMGRNRPKVLLPFVVVWQGGDLTIVRATDEAAVRTWASGRSTAGPARVLAVAERTVSDLGDVPITVIDPPV